MAIYDPKSLKAEEFINDEEIRETLKYAEENKNNAVLIDEILEKARPKRPPQVPSARDLPTERLPFFWPARYPKKSKRFIR